MYILMCKEPSCIRCIKPNDVQTADTFDDKLILHQVKYLRLMENLRVRRAGFAYLRTYEMFLQRYKCLSKEMWPHYKSGSARDGVQVLAYFIDERISKQSMTEINNFVTSFGIKKLKYSTSVIKFDRHGYKPRERFFLFSDYALYLLDTKTFKQKHRLPLDKIDFCITNELDNLIPSIPSELKKDKVDIILQIPEIIKFCKYIIH